MLKNTTVKWISAEAGYLYYLHELIHKHIRDNYNETLYEKELMDKLYYLGIAIAKATKYKDFKNIHEQLERVLKYYTSYRNTKVSISDLMKSKLPSC